MIAPGFLFAAFRIRGQRYSKLILTDSALLLQLVAAVTIVAGTTADGNDVRAKRRIARSPFVKRRVAAAVCRQYLLIGHERIAIDPVRRRSATMREVQPRAIRQRDRRKLTTHHDPIRCGAGRQ